MAVFVTTENQLILWRMLQQHPQFYSMEFSQKNVLFRKTIEAIYFENEHVQLNYQQLIELNKKTLRVILDRIISKPVIVESSEDRSVREFREREEVYQKMTKKPDLPDAKKMFEEPVVDDDVITNMEERLLQYQSQRSLDISNIEIQQNQQNQNQDQDKNQSMVEEMMKKIQELEQRVAALEKN